MISPPPAGPAGLPGLAGLPQVGDLIAGKYRLVAVLGRGGMGIVFDAHHELLDRKVALKVLAPEVSTNPEAVTRFMNEARAAARITSDRVVGVLDVGALETGLPYMVMERLEGVDLGELFSRQQTPVSIADVVDLLAEAVEGVSHAHLAGIIHRDLKPSNLFLALRPDHTRIVKVLDFGISKLTGPARSPSGSVTATRAILGSPLYMSPEQLRGSKTIDHRADIWSLGVIAYELLTRTLPFEGENIVELFAAIQERDARPLVELRAEVPPGLDEAVRTCLRRSPEQRFSSAFAFGKALEPYGTVKAHAAMERLEAHVTAKGRSVEDLRATMAEDRQSVSGSAPQNLFGITPSGMHGDPQRASRPTPVAQGKSVVPQGPSTGNSTQAPWAVTGSGPSRPRMIGVSALALAGTLVVGVGAVGLLRGHLTTTTAGGAGETADAASTVPAMGATGSTGTTRATVDAHAEEDVGPADAAPPPLHVEDGLPVTVPPDAGPPKQHRRHDAGSGTTPQQLPAPLNMNAY